MVYEWNVLLPFLVYVYVWYRCHLIVHDWNPPQTASTSPSSTCRLSMDDHILLDVRAKEQFNICRIPGAINTPWKNFETHVDYIREMVLQKGGGRGDQGTLDDSTTAAIPVTVICRRGNDSQRALKRLHELGFEQGVDVIGGVESWAKSVDPTFPLY